MSTTPLGRKRFQERRAPQDHRDKRRRGPRVAGVQLGRLLGATWRGAIAAELHRGLAPVAHWKRLWWIVPAIDPHYRLPEEKQLPWWFFLRRLVRPVAHCVYCRCADDHACPGGCSWISATPAVCSSCEHDHTYEQLRDALQ